MTLLTHDAARAAHCHGKLFPARRAVFIVGVGRRFLCSGSRR
jgi:hypothetical protein